MQNIQELMLAYYKHCAVNQRIAGIPDAEHSADGVLWELDSPFMLAVVDQRTGDVTLAEDIAQYFECSTEELTQELALEYLALGA